METASGVQNIVLTIDITLRISTMFGITIQQEHAHNACLYFPDFLGSWIRQSLADKCIISFHSHYTKIAYRPLYLVIFIRPIF
jgi:hypothetical protein